MERDEWRQESERQIVSKCGRVMRSRSIGDKVSMKKKKEADTRVENRAK